MDTLYIEAVVSSLLFEPCRVKDSARAEESRRSTKYHGDKIFKRPEDPFTTIAFCSERRVKSREGGGLAQISEFSSKRGASR